MGWISTGCWRNDLGDPPQAGQRLLVPDETVLVRLTSAAAVLDRRAYTHVEQRIMWPVTGPITTYFYDPGHRGIDIAADEGDPIYASDGGVVITAIKDYYNYGWHLIIDHGNGYQSLYGHMSAFYVDSQETVAKGQKIGAVGDTGYSFGPHLHFEIHYNGAKLNPLNLLP